MTEDLYITGGHSILVPTLTDEQREQIIKNFGFTKFADFDDSDDEEDPDHEGMEELGIFDGNPAKERDEYRQRVLDHFYG